MQTNDPFLIYLAFVFGALGIILAVVLGFFAVDSVDDWLYERNFHNGKFGLIEVNPVDLNENPKAVVVDKTSEFIRPAGGNKIIQNAPLTYDIEQDITFELPVNFENFYAVTEYPYPEHIQIQKSPNDGFVILGVPKGSTIKIVMWATLGKNKR